MLNLMLFGVLVEIIGTAQALLRVPIQRWEVEGAKERGLGGFSLTKTRTSYLLLRCVPFWVGGAILIIWGLVLLSATPA